MVNETFLAEFIKEASLQYKGKSVEVVRRNFDGGGFISLVLGHVQKQAKHFFALEFSRLVAKSTKICILSVCTKIEAICQIFAVFGGYSYQF